MTIAPDPDKQYTERLLRKQEAPWKKILDVQAPYRWNLRQLSPGFTLEVGCGIGRNLAHLEGRGVGVDTNPHSVAVAKERGLVAFTIEGFRASPYHQPETFDSILLSHVAEHMTSDQVVECIRSYLPTLKRDGRLILITPQEAGYRSDSTHVEFMDFGRLETILTTLGFRGERSFSFPFPRWMGQLFVYNEFVVVGKR
jgi:SAM-dependent methyltransferase